MEFLVGLVFGTFLSSRQYKRAINSHKTLPPQNKKKNQTATHNADRSFTDQRWINVDSVDEMHLRHKKSHSDFLLLSQILYGL